MLDMKEKSLEELQGMLQTFPEAYKDMFGHELDLNMVKVIALGHLADLQKQRIKEWLGGLGPMSTIDLIRLVEKRIPSKPPIDNDSHVQRQGKIAQGNKK